MRGEPRRAGARPSRHPPRHQHDARELPGLGGPQPGSPADKIGLHPTTRDNQTGRIILGDILVRFGKERLKKADELFNALDAYKVGDKVEIEYLRDGQVQKATTTLERIN